YNQKIAESKGFIVLKPSKITPNEASDFRKEIFDFGSSFNVVKNSIFRLSLKENNIDLGLDKGEYAVVFLSEDIVGPSKSLKKFMENAKTADGESKIEIVSGILDGSVLTKEQVTELSEM